MDPADPFDVRGWVKVKAYGPDGVLKSECVSEVSLIPPTAIVVSKRDQRVFHFSNGAVKSVFICSTALPKYDLDPGVYRVYSKQPRHWSREYGVWMDHSLFFHEGYALHATTMVRRFGRPASHGCIRLRPRDAAKLYSNVVVGTPVIVLPRSRECSFLIDEAKNASKRARADGCCREKVAEIQNRKSKIISARLLAALECSAIMKTGAAFPVPPAV